MSTGLGALVRVTDCKFCGVQNWTFWVETSALELVSPIVVNHAPAHAWEYLSVSAYLTRIGPSSDPVHDSQSWGYGTFEGGYVNSAGVKSVAGTWDCPFMHGGSNGNIGSFPYISGGFAPGDVIAADGKSFLFTTYPNSWELRGIPVGIEAGLIAGQTTAANRASAQTAADAENARRLAESGQPGQHAVIKVWTSDSTYSLIPSRIVFEITSVDFDQANCRFNVYGYPDNASNLQLIDVIDPFA